MKKKHNVGVPITAIEAMVEYLYHDEERDCGGEPTRDHIFYSVKRVADWLDTIKGGAVT